MSKREDLIAPEHKAEIEKIRAAGAEKAMEIIRVTMPKKVIELNELLESPLLTVPLEKVRQLIGADLKASSPSSMDSDGAPAKKKRKAANGTAEEADTDAEASEGGQRIPCNAPIQAAMKVLKAQLLEFLDHVNTVKIWIQLNIPRIEDGNNFGVSIQEETLGELGRAEESAFSTFSAVQKYYQVRAKWIGKSLKHPNVADFRHAVYELDEKEYLAIFINFKDLRNNYSLLHDMISKNWDKIRKPRSENAMTLY